MASKRTSESLPLFASFARAIERQVGRSSTFVLAVGIVLVWAASGPLFDWSDTWQLVINTGTTIVTFLMVFVIQNTQSRDTMALHLKIDELIRVTAKARDELVGAEEMSDTKIVEARETLNELAVAEEVVAKTASTRATGAKAARKTSAKPRANGRKTAAAEATAPAL
ncbi:MAG TPA: low affinity iron permease family protein [Stellaceae bacterium]|jgi:low affinity Fe/Cu permease|nr:low affinity iron permease family protein [Stellaceae bacterium]